MRTAGDIIFSDICTNGAVVFVNVPLLSRLLQHLCGFVTRVSSDPSARVRARSRCYRPSQQQARELAFHSAGARGVSERVLENCWNLGERCPLLFNPLVVFGHFRPGFIYLFFENCKNRYFIGMVRNSVTFMAFNYETTKKKKTVDLIRKS